MIGFSGISAAGLSSQIAFRTAASAASVATNTASTIAMTASKSGWRVPSFDINKAAASPAAPTEGLNPSVLTHDGYTRRAPHKEGPIVPKWYGEPFA